MGDAAGTQLVIREMKKEDLVETAKVLSQAFSTSPNTLAMRGGRVVSAEKLSHIFVGRFRYLPGHKYVAESGGRTVGAMRVGEWPVCEGTFRHTLMTMPYALRSIGGLSNISRALEFQNTFKKVEPTRPHFHLDSLGVVPDMQGQGIGSQMVDFYCHIIDRKGIEAYHETDKVENVPFYERFGFKVIGQETILGATNWFMLRSPG